MSDPSSTDDNVVSILMEDEQVLDATLQQKLSADLSSFDLYPSVITIGPSWIQPQLYMLMPLSRIRASPEICLVLLHDV